MRFVTFHTGGQYKAMAERAQASARKLRFDVEIYERPDLGRWGANIHQKAPLLLEVMDRTGEDVVWVDADLYFVKYPALLHEVPDGADVAAYCEGKACLWGGLTWHRASPSGREILEAWIEKNKVCPGFSDDSNLRWVLNQRAKARLFKLPPAYAWNPELMRHRFSGAQPVVVHDMVVTAMNPAERADVWMRDDDGQERVMRRVNPDSST